MSARRASARAWLVAALCAGAMAAATPGASAAAAGDRWVWPGPPNSALGSPAFFDPRRGALCFVDYRPAPVLWTLSADPPRTWTPTPIDLRGPWIDSRWSYDPVHDRVFFPDLGFDDSVHTVPPRGFTYMAQLTLGAIPRLENVPLRGPRPDGRESAMSVYDSRRQRVLVFGGHPVYGIDTLSTRLDALDVAADSATWSSIDVTSPALTVEAAQAVYDSVTDRVIVFGGDDVHGNPSGGVYSLDLGSPSGWRAWALADTLDTRFSDLSGARTCIDPVRRRLLYVRSPVVLRIDGAQPGARERLPGTAVRAARAPAPAATNDFFDRDTTVVWELDLDHPVAWRPCAYVGRSPDSRPDQFAYDAQRNRITTYGSYGRNQLDELVLDGNSPWSRLGDSGYVPAEDLDAHAFLDRGGRGALVVETLFPEVARLTRNPGETWSWLPVRGAYPDVFAQHATVVYDSTTSRGIVFGGSLGATASGDLWQFSVDPTDSVTWQKVVPAGDLPSARLGASAVFDPLRQRVILFGGYGTQAMGDTWELTLGPPARWRRLADRGLPPSARFAASAVYDSRRDGMLLFGGNTGSPDAPLLSNETYALSFADGDAWVPRNALGRLPAPRAGHGAVYDPLRDRMIVFWGHSYTGGRSDCAELDLTGASTWQVFAPPGGAPPSRGEFGAAYDAEHDQALLVGGQELAGGEVSFPDYLYADFSANPVRNPPPLVGPPLSVLGLAPNPTRDAENVAFGLPVDADVHAQIYAANGRLVRDLGTRRYAVGTHVLPWDGTDATGRRVASGVYLARLSALGSSFSGKFVLFR